MKAKNLLLAGLVIVVIFFLSGCAGVQRMADLKDGPKYDVAMSGSTFLAMNNAPKTIYSRVQNTSAVQRAKAIVRNTLASEVTSNGYEVSSNPSSSTYISQISIRYAGEYKEGMSFGGTLGGASLGALTGIGLTNNYSHMGRNAVGGSLIGAGIGMVLDFATRVKTFVVLIDYQITEDLRGYENYIGAVVKSTQVISGAKETGRSVSNVSSQEIVSTTKEVTSSIKGVTIYTGSVAAKAEQLNMSDGDPTEELLRRATAQIAGIFE